MMDYSLRGHPWPSGRFGYSRGLAVDGSEMDLSGRIIKLSELLFFFFLTRQRWEIIGVVGVICM